MQKLLRPLIFIGSLLACGLAQAEQNLYTAYDPALLGVIAQPSDEQTCSYRFDIYLRAAMPQTLVEVSVNAQGERHVALDRAKGVVGGIMLLPLAAVAEVARLPFYYLTPLGIVAAFDSLRPDGWWQEGGLVNHAWENVTAHLKKCRMSSAIEESVAARLEQTEALRQQAIREGRQVRVNAEQGRLEFAD